MSTESPNTAAVNKKKRKEFATPKVLNLAKKKPCRTPISKMADKGSQLKTGEQISTDDTNISMEESNVPSTSSGKAPASKPKWLDSILSEFKFELFQENIKLAESVTKNVIVNVNENVTSQISTLGSNMKDQITNTMEIQSKELKAEIINIKKSVDDNKTQADKQFSDFQKKMVADMKQFQADVAIAAATAATAANTATVAAASSAVAIPAQFPAQNPPEGDFYLTITVDGIEESRNEQLLILLQEYVFELMGLNFNANHIQQCFRLGRDPVPNTTPASPGGARTRPRPVFVMFNDRSQKSVVMRRRHKLQGSHVWVNHSFSPAVEKDRRRIYPIIRKARSLGEEYHDRIRQRDDKLILDGKEYGVADFDDLPNNIHPRHICTETRGGITFFFKMDSPLSNHHPCKIESDHQTFNCVEQGYFYNKAVICVLCLFQFSSCLFHNYVFIYFLFAGIF